MKKSYFLAYGITGYSADELAQIMNEIFDIEIVRCEGSFYLLGGHFYRAVITTQSNFVGYPFNDWAEFEDQEFPVIMYIGNSMSSNRDNASTHKYLKHHLQQLEYVTLLEESIIE